MYRKSMGDYIFIIANYTFLALLCVLFLYPFYYILMYSLSDPIQAAKGAALLYPSRFNLQNYATILKQPEIYRAAMVSVGRTVLGTSITVFCCSFFAYLLTLDQLPFRKIILRFLVITMYMSAGLIPYYLLISALGLKNNFLVYVVPSAISAYFVILIRTYIQQMPKELEESALMDGAGITRVYRSIIFPLCKPIVAAISVFAAVGQWNAWFDNMMYVTKRSLFTLQYILYQFLAGAQATAMAAREAANMAEFGQNSVSAVTPMSIQMTITVIAVVPIFVVYPFFQRYFAKGIMIGAVKG